MRKCIRCNAEMIENLDVKVEGRADGIKITQQGIFRDNLGMQFVQNVVTLKPIFKIQLK